MTHCWISVWWNPVSPSTHTIRMNSTPRFFLFRMESQNFALSFFPTYILVPFHVDPDVDINRTLYDPSFMAHMIVAGIHENNRVNFFQYPFLPFFYNRKKIVRNPPDGTIGNFNILQFPHMTFDIVCSHFFCIHGDNVFFHVLGDRILIFLYDLWFKLTLQSRGMSISISP